MNQDSLYDIVSSVCLKARNYRLAADQPFPTEYELGVLARHYLDVLQEARYESIVYCQCGSPHWNIYCSARLDAIENELGAVAFESAVEGMRKEFDDRLRQIEQEIEDAAPCKGCGKPRENIPLGYLLINPYCSSCSERQSVVQASRSMNQNDPDGQLPSQTS